MTNITIANWIYDLFSDWLVSYLFHLLRFSLDRTSLRLFSLVNKFCLRHLAIVLDLDECLDHIELSLSLFLHR